jgi:hypothetical protein
MSCPDSKTVTTTIVETTTIETVTVVKDQSDANRQDECDCDRPVPDVFGKFVREAGAHIHCRIHGGSSYRPRGDGW